MTTQEFLAAAVMAAQDAADMVRVLLKKPQPPNNTVHIGGTVVTSQPAAHIEAAMYERLWAVPDSQFVGKMGYRRVQEGSTGDTAIMASAIEGTAFGVRLSASASLVAASDDTNGVLACLVADHGSSRIWHAAFDEGTTLCADPTNAPDMCRVWEGSLLLNSPSVLFMGDYDPLSGVSPEEYARMCARAQKLGRTMSFGSDVLASALIANGSEGAAGQIIFGGAPWSMLAALLVINSGGTVRAYRPRPNEPGRFLPANPLKPGDASLMIIGNSEDTVHLLMDEVVLRGLGKLPK